MTRTSAQSIVRIPLLADVIVSGDLVPAFQPIVSVGDPSAVLGFEALMRFRGASFFADPGVLFEYALRKKAVVELDMTCIERSLLYGAALTEPELLFVNIRPELLSRPCQLFKLVTQTAAACDLSLSSLVLEITEDAAISNRQAAIENLSRLRDVGVRFALDDVGIAHSHLNLIEMIAPAFLKISHEFGHDFEKDETRIRIVRNFVSLAQDFSAEVILEGVETQATRRAAASMGIQKAQGYLFSRPIALDDALTFKGPQYAFVKPVPDAVGSSVYETGQLET